MAGRCEWRRRDEGGRTVRILRLYDFEIASSDFQYNHRPCLRELARLLRSLGPWISEVRVVGGADPPGPNSFNRWIAQRRAERVHRYITAEVPNPPFYLRHPEWVTWDNPFYPQGEYLPYDRSVEVRIYPPRMPPPPQVQWPEATPDTPRPPRTTKFFWIKYGGMLSVSIGFGGDVGGFVIRDENHEYQFYVFGGLSGSVGPAVGTSGAAPRGEGWAQFEARRSVSVSDFGGPASVGQAGVTVGPVGVGVFQFEFGNASTGRFSLGLQTGGGLSAGAAMTIPLPGPLPAGALVPVEERYRGPGWQRL